MAQKLKHMQEIPIYQVDAFTDHAFGGNPAAVCVLEKIFDDALLQSIALENNLSETAFLVPHDEEGADYHLRWFTPGVEVALCGHATLASAHVVFNHLQQNIERVRFQTLSGILTVMRNGDRYQMDFPALKPLPYNKPDGLGAAMGAEPDAVLKSETGDRDLLLVYNDIEVVETLTPNFEALKAFAPYGFIATASENIKDTRSDVDFVSRCFFPNHGIGEDPVTGSAHCVSGPYWASKLGKADLFARQISPRGGDLWLEVKDERILISGQAVQVLYGQLSVPIQ
ncbi:PhzF family phenazine biosynthesis protein [Kordiimonas aquimaris]|uniref:PhzF family phenazine biosynthesis protein n=1 Tax=Kordiimonas aquimaris TaxID=707591 RepID=UPI0021D3B55B|nr:PhzF family phenazine biosynthesis protein [Kordiimonas aquimaris]